MKKNKKEKRISDLLSEISSDITDEIIELLEIEYSIKLKKAMGKKLTKDEYFFDTFIISPSTLVETIYKRF